MPAAHRCLKVVLVASAALVSQRLQAGDPEVRIIADATTVIPEFDGSTFESFGGPALSGANVAFFGRGHGREGIYALLNGRLVRIADRTTIMPGLGVNFAFFTAPAIDGSVVAFGGSGAGAARGIYTGSGRGLTVIADRMTTIPGTRLLFTQFGTPSISGGGQVVFRGSGVFGAVDGVYRSEGGRLSIVVDNQTTRAPGGGLFEGFAGSDSEDGDVAFRGMVNGAEGIFAMMDSRLMLLVMQGDPVPDSKAIFDILDNPIVGGGRVALSGVDQAFSPGLYLWDDGKLEMVVDAATPIPGGRGNFIGFQNWAVDAQRVVFQGLGPDGQSAIYLSQDHAITPLVRVGDAFGRQTITEVFFSSHGLDSGSLALAVLLSDGSAAVFTTALPGAPAPADLNGDGTVDGIDLGILLAQWSSSGSADLNGDDNVNGIDLGILLANWTL